MAPQPSTSTAPQPSTSAAGNGTQDGPQRPANWKRVADEDVHAPPHTFGVRNPGPRQMPPRNSSPIEYFFLLFTVATFRTLLNNTKAYGEEYLRGMRDWIQLHPRSRFRRWKVDDINITMLKKYIGWCINMGLCSEEEREGLLGPEIPVTVCSLLCECHASAQVLDVFAAAACWCNEPSLQGQPGFDPWNKVRPVLDALNAQFKVHYVPGT